MMNNKFLTTILEQTDRTVYAKITSLNINNTPIEQIEGEITSGSISIDGKSSVRRVCNLTMVVPKININDYYWQIKTKIKIEIGLANQLKGEYSPMKNEGTYPDIVWFLQGYYSISSFNTSISTTGLTISLQGKDKMCLLNGELSGQLPSLIDFGTEEIETFQMEHITINQLPSSSEGLLNQKYYYILPSNEIFDYTSFYDNDEQYLFIYNPEGNFYKERNLYRNITTLSEADSMFAYKRYDVYKKCSVKDLFETISLNGSTYEINKYYIKNDYNYYSLSLAPFNDKTTYYSIRNDLYQPYITVEKNKIPIKKILQNLIHCYANEPYENIIINDLDELGLEQLTYIGDTPLYAFYNVMTGEYVNLILKNNLDGRLKTIIEKLSDYLQFNSLTDSIYFTGSEIAVFNSKYLGIKDKETQKYLIYNESEHKIQRISEPQQIKEALGLSSSTSLSEEQVYTLTEIKYGQEIGYRITDLVHPGDLICNAGDTITSVLDKIKQVLGEFEYFYDLEGRFVFQKKKNYIQTSWNEIMSEDKDFYINKNINNKISFSFINNKLISAIQNTPVLNNLRNDYSIWGQRKTGSTSVPIHIRYAIDKKPVYYKNLKNEIYITEKFLENEEKPSNSQVVDWRELIYQMASDYFQAGELDNFLFEIGSRNQEYYSSGKTGYEQYYTDVYSFWRDLYNPDYRLKKEYSQEAYELNLSDQGRYEKKFVPSEVLYTTEYYFTNGQSEIGPTEMTYDLRRYYCSGSDNDQKSKYKYWNINVFEHPDILNFWFDFLDAESEDLEKISVPIIGPRQKTINENTGINSVIYSAVPNFIFYNDNSEQNNITTNFPGYIPIQFGNLSADAFKASSRGISLTEKLDELLYSNSYCAESITLTAIPIYNLEPNTRIFISDEATGIKGEYVIDKFSLSLLYNNMMQVSATKVPPQTHII